jgi:hypothetical protein
MKNVLRKACSFLIPILLLVCVNAAASPDIPWPTKETVAEVSAQLTEQHREQLIAESLKDKYVPGSTNLFDIVYYHVYVSVHKDGSEVTYEDTAIRANTPQARQVLGEHTMRFNEGRESTDVLQAVVYLTDGTRIRTDTTAVRMREPFTNLVYSDIKVKVLSIKGIEEGSIVRVVSKRTYRPGVEKGFVLLPLLIDPAWPLREGLMIVRVEPGTKVIKKERINQPFPQLDANVFTTVGGDGYYVYWMSNVTQSWSRYPRQ